jgi:hypothetical protein
MNNSSGRTTLADRIRRFAFETYVLPLRGARDSEILIRAGDLHKAMGLGDRMPAVCGLVIELDGSIVVTPTAAIGAIEPSGSGEPGAYCCPRADSQSH